ncbi:hypothetical protein ACJD0Z_00435 [Flavobacteriaceae bacterium M23B6Z8]
MKKKSLKNLNLNKKTISKFDIKATGGLNPDRDVDEPTDQCGFTHTWCNLSCWVACFSDGLPCRE